MRRIAIGATVGVLILAGCGEDDSGSGDSIVSENPAENAASSTGAAEEDTASDPPDAPDDSEEFVEATPPATVDEVDADRGAGGTFPLVATSWVLRSYSVDREEIAVEEGTEATLLIEDGSIALLTGCNAGSGPVDVDDTTLTVGNVALTRRACFGAAADAESVVVATLDGTADYVVDGDTLTVARDGPTRSFELVYTAS